MLTIKIDVLRLVFGIVAWESEANSTEDSGQKSWPQIGMEEKSKNDLKKSRMHTFIELR